jgi:hypothetical protein
MVSEKRHPVSKIARKEPLYLLRALVNIVLSPFDRKAPTLFNKIHLEPILRQHLPLNLNYPLRINFSGSKSP